MRDGRRIIFLEGKQVYPMCDTSDGCILCIKPRVSLPNNKKRNLLHTGRLLERDESTMGRLLEGGQACLFDKELKFPYQSAAAVDMSPLRHLLNSVATAAPVGKEFLKSFRQ